MKRLFVDTAGWMMLADAADPSHKRALDCRDRWMETGATLVSSDYVADETLTLIRVRLGLDAAERWWALVSESTRLHWEQIDGDRAERARSWFFGWRDKMFSFTDCTSFVVMKDRRIRHVLTSDQHFAQAGFERVP